MVSLVAFVNISLDSGFVLLFRMPRGVTRPQWVDNPQYFLQHNQIYYIHLRLIYNWLSLNIMHEHVDGLAQDCGISTVLAKEIQVLH